MAKDNSVEAKIKLVFASYPEAKSFYFTSDGNAFSQENDAKNHAKSLEDKMVMKITREMAKSGQIEAKAASQEIVKEVQDGGAKNEFQAAGTVREVSLDGEPGEGVPYGKDDQGRTVSEIATDVAQKMEAAKDRVTEDSVTDSSDAAEAAEKEAASVEAPKADAPVKESAKPAAKKESSTKKK